MSIRLALGLSRFGLLTEMVSTISMLPPRVDSELILPERERRELCRESTRAGASTVLFGGKEEYPLKTEDERDEGLLLVGLPAAPRAARGGPWPWA